MTTETKPVLPVRRVTLYTSGVGYFERSGEIEGRASLTLRFPLGQINDVLSSLVLFDGGGGTILPVTYGAQDPIGRTLRAFSVNLGDNPGRLALLKRMRGAEVTITTHTGAQPVSGTVLGVEKHTAALPDGQGTVENEILNLLSQSRLRSIPMDRVESIDILDEALAEELRLALAAVGRSRDTATRPLTFTFEGDGARTAMIGYLTETSAWQTSYRLVIPDPAARREAGSAQTARIQGWAIVQNTSLDDWRDITLTLVSGRPISFIQDLYSPLYVHRPTVASRIQAAPTPQAYGSDLGAVSAAPAPSQPRSKGGGRVLNELFSEAGPEDTMAPGAVASGVANVRQRKISSEEEQRKLERNLSRGLITQEEFQALSSTGAQLGDALFSYAIDLPVTVPREESAMIPFLSGEAGTAIVSVYSREVLDNHPLLGILLTNTTGLHLMGGPITVFSAGPDGGIAYVGEALIDDTEPEQTRILTYAVDLAVDIACDAPEFDQAVAGFAVSAGTVRIHHRNIRATQYRIRNHDAADRPLVIEHRPAGPEWALIEPQEPDERTAHHLRFRRTVAGGASDMFIVHEQYDYWQSMGLVEAPVTQFNWVAAHAAVTGEQRAAIEEILARRGVMEDIARRVETIRRQLGDIDKQQERVRQNMVSLDRQSDLYRRYIAQLDAQETEIAGLQLRLRTEETALEAARKELADFVAALEI
jgi:hypothetical protein